MEWGKLLSEKRIRELLEDKPANPSKPDERTQHGRDYDRAIFSTPVRRMQDKTQVFPLEPNDSVRTRLTHSLEVSNIARNMARSIGNWLFIEKEIKESQRNSIEIIATTCGLIHDLGNPPFGHAGEDAIKGWFKKKDDNFYEFVKGIYNGEQLKSDFLKFEGNAQTIRLISKLQVLADFHGLNLTCATMSAACKYIASAKEITKDLHEKSKLGFFTSEQGLIEKIQEETGTKDIRNPISYIVESADDIAFSVVDIEDGVKKGVISWDNLKEKLKEEFKEALEKYSQSDPRKLEFCFSKADEYLKKADPSILKKGKPPILEKGKPLDNAMAQAFRVFVIIESAKAIKKAFREKYEDIMNGNYHGELYEDSEAGALIEACKEIGQKYIYCSKENLKLELMGRRVIHDLMDIFWKGALTGSKKEKGFERKIFDLTSKNYRVVYDKAIEEQKFPAEYCSMQLMTDYICGMTDTFACTLHKRLTNG